MKAILLFSIVFVTSFNAKSQCDKKITWYAAKGEMLDASGALLDTKTDSVFFEVGPQNLSLRFKSDEKGLEGTINDKTCDWKEPFKNGKTVYHSTVSVDDRTSNATLTLEGKDGKITLLVVIDALEGKKFRIYMGGYKEM